MSSASPKQYLRELGGREYFATLHGGEDERHGLAAIQ